MKELKWIPTLHTSFLILDTPQHWLQASQTSNRFSFQARHLNGVNPFLWEARWLFWAQLGWDLVYLSAGNRMFIKSERRKRSRENWEPFNPSPSFSGFRCLAPQGFCVNEASKRFHSCTLRAQLRIRENFTTNPAWILFFAMLIYSSNPTVWLRSDPNLFPQQIQNYNANVYCWL